jgi:hypothetical protein
MGQRKQIAQDMVEYIKQNRGVCGEIRQAHNLWIRFAGGDWQAVKYTRSSDRLRSYIVGNTPPREDVVELCSKNGVVVLPVSDAGYRQKDSPIWDAVEKQGVFNDVARCFWCGCSEAERELQSYETVEDGVCNLCNSCEESWRSAGEIVEVAQSGVA